MTEYNSNLKTWGSVGEEYPSGYQYVKGEQPIDEWDNFVNRNLIKDVKHLVELTNKRLDTSSGTSYPGSPTPGHVAWRSDSRVLAVYDENNSSWRELAYKADVENIDLTYVEDDIQKVADDLFNHESDTSNPHNVTTTQIGAATQADHDLLDSAFSSHESSGNPHTDSASKTYADDTADSSALTAQSNAANYTDSEISTHSNDENAHHSEQHGSDQHDTDDLHNDAVGIPTYSSLSNVPAIPAGHAVVVGGELYIEDGN